MTGKSAIASPLLGTTRQLARTRDSRWWARSQYGNAVAFGIHTVSPCFLVNSDTTHWGSHTNRYTVQRGAQMKQQSGTGGRETVKGTVSQSTHGSVIELRSSIISAAKKNVHQSWTLATLSQGTQLGDPVSQSVFSRSRPALTPPLQIGCGGVGM